MRDEGGGGKMRAKEGKYEMTWEREKRGGGGVRGEEEREVKKIKLLTMDTLCRVFPLVIPSLMFCSSWDNYNTIEKL